MGENKNSDKKRWERIEQLGYDYQKQPKNKLGNCPLCEANNFVLICHQDRYRFKAPSVFCKKCGLVFLNPVMTDQAYQDFYKNTYRPLVSAYHGRTIDSKTIQNEQKEYARNLMGFLKFASIYRDIDSILDIGGSTGVVSGYICEKIKAEATVVDPAPKELEEARARGLDVVEGMVEEQTFAGEKYDLILLCQTVDHLLDVQATLDKARKLLSEDGLFFVDIVDFRASFLGRNSVWKATKIDHPYAFTRLTMESLLARTGFKILKTNFAKDGLHVGYLCSKTTPENGFPKNNDLEDLLKEIRMIQSAKVVS